MLTPSLTPSCPQGVLLLVGGRSRGVRAWALPAGLQGSQADPVVLAVALVSTMDRAAAFPPRVSCLVTALEVPAQLCPTFLT